MGISGSDGDKRKLAGLIAATTLCGELSLTAALASHDLAKAHQKLGRNLNSNA